MGVREGRWISREGVRGVSEGGKDRNRGKEREVDQVSKSVMYSVCQQLTGHVGNGIHQLYSGTLHTQNGMKEIIHKHIWAEVIY